MKVVIFCGGLGMRLREYSEAVPKPMVPVGYRQGEDLVEEPFQRLASEGKLVTYEHDGFWACLDTFKERQLLEDIDSRGQPPWEVWRKDSQKGRLAGK